MDSSYTITYFENLSIDNARKAEQDRAVSERNTLRTTTTTTIDTGYWAEVPGQWVGGQWVPSHKVWVPANP